jgi:hypothetical protein
MWDGTLQEQPDEDTLEELNLPEINTTVLKSIFESNQTVV